MSPLFCRYFVALAVLAQGAVFSTKQVMGQTVIPAPTATTQVVDFRVADGTWEDFEQTYLDGQGVETTVNAGPEVETFDVATRSVEEFDETGSVLEGLMGTFKGLSQNADGVVRGHNRVNPNRGEDFVLETFALRTNVKQFSRYSGQGDVTRDNGRAGTLQWGFDLSTLDTYLTNESLALDSLELNLRASWPALQDRTYDLLLSYTNPSEGITLGEISTEVGTEAGSYPGSEANWHILFKPSRTGNVGDLVGDDPRTTGVALGDYNSDDNVDVADYTVWRDAVGGDTLDNRDPANTGPIGPEDYTVWRNNFGATAGGPVIEPNTHKIVAKDVRGDADTFTVNDHITTIDILDLYNQGVREFNLVAVSAGFGDNDNFGIVGPAVESPNDISDPLSFGSGVYISTSPAAGALASPTPEPSSLALMMLGAAGLLARRRK